MRVANLKSCLLQDGAIGEDWVSDCCDGREKMFLSRLERGGGGEGVEARMGLEDKGEETDGRYWGVSKVRLKIGCCCIMNIV